MQKVFAFALLLSISAVSSAADVKGGHDHRLISRYAGSTLIGYSHSDWAQTTFPLAAEMERGDQEFAKSETVEGEITRLVYLGPRGKSPLEVFRNYDQALKVAGFQERFRCELNCDRIFFHWRFGESAGGMHWAEGYLNSAQNPNHRWNLVDAIAGEQGRAIYGTITRDGRTAHVSVYTSIAGYLEVEASATVVEIAEPKSMQTGQVTVNSDALAKGLAADGRVALYGVYFDTGKAVLKPESDAQLKEMAQLLKQDAALRVFIVGHTDNQGQLADNLKLSLARAQAVRDALMTRFKVDGARLLPHGLANLAPVASNAAEDGRSRNRRVELVMQ